MNSSFQPDFEDSAKRHWSDAKLLIENNRLPNADQVFGLSAECALKYIMLKNGLVLEDGKPKEKKFRKHIDELWDHFRDFIENRNGVFFMSFTGIGSNPFHDWDIGQRYHNSQYIRLESVKNHEKAVDNIIDLLYQTDMDGRVR